MRRLLRHPWLLPAAVAALLYVPTLGAPFVWDDHLILEKNSHLALSEIPRHFGTDLFSQSREETRKDRYSPLTLSLYSLVHAVAPETPPAYHLLSLAVHALNAALTALLALRLTSRRGAALAAGVLFAVLPIHVETVVWASALHTLVWTSFGLCALLAATSERGPLARSLLATVALAAALLSKESALAIVLVLPLLDAARGGRRALRANLPVYAALGAVVAAYFGLRAAIGVPSGGALLEGRTLAERVGDVTALWRTLLSASVGVEAPDLVRPFLSDEIGLAALTLVLVLAAALTFWLFQLRAALAGLSLFLAALLPFALVAPSTGLLSDRYAYFPAVGLALCAAGLAPWPPSRRAALLFGALVVALAVRGSLYAREWQDDERLFRFLAARTPGSAIAHHLLGRILLERGRLAEGRQELRAAVAARPNFGPAWADLLDADLRLGNFDAVIADSPRALGSRDTDAAVHAHIASAYLVRGDLAAAARHVARARERAPRDPHVLLITALLKLRGGDALGAGRLLEPLTAALGDDPQYWRTYGLALLRLGDRPGAREKLLRARALAPADPLILRLWREAGGSAE
jgi:tetratricopeptide (TPR) repeat protein